MKLINAFLISVFLVQLVYSSVFRSNRRFETFTENNLIKQAEDDNNGGSGGGSNDIMMTTDNPIWENRKNDVKFDRTFTLDTEEKISTDKVREAANAVKLFVAETIYDVEKIARKFSTGVYRTASAFAADTLQLITTARDNIADVISVIAIKILEIDDEIVRQFFENLKDVLEKVQEIFKKILGQAEFEFRNILNHVNNSLMIIGEDMEDWSRNIKFKLKTVKNDEIYKKGCEYIDTFVSTSVEEAYDCCNIAIKPMKTICKNAKDIIGDTLSILVDILEKVEVCILEKKARVHVMIACFDDAYDKVTELMKHVSNLKEDLFRTLPSKIMISNFCISMAAVSVEVRKIDIANEIDEKYLN